MRSTGLRWHKQGRRGVSDVVATILLLALTVTLFASIFAFVTAFPSPPPQNNNQFQASLSFTANMSYISAIHILHLAGPSVSGNALIYLKSANQPTAPEFQNPYTVSSGLSGSSVWNLGQVWNLTFPVNQRPIATGNITLYVVASSQLLFSVVLPGTSIVAPPTIVSTSIAPALPVVGGSFTVYATISGTYTTQSVYLNLAGVPNSGALNSPLKMTQNSQGQWTYFVGAGLTTASGTFYGFVNASSASGTRGQQATGAIVITISNGGTTNGPFSVGIVLVPSPPNTGSTETVQAVVTYTGTLATPEALNVSFTAISSPYVAGNRWTGWAPTGATIVGGTSVTVVSKTTWTVPANPTTGTSFLVYANATVATVGTIPGTMTFTPAYLSLSLSSGLIGSSVTATGSNFVGVTPVSFYEGGVLATITGCTSDTSFTAASVVTTSTGAFVCTVQIAAGTPFTAATMVATDATTGQNDTAAFAVNDWSISPVAPTSGVVGTSVTVTGVYFAASSVETLAFNGVTVTPTSSGTCTLSGTGVKASGTGGFSCVVTVPASSLAGSATITATNATWKTTATASFTVTGWTISPLSVTSGVIGTSVTVTGTGFAVSSGVVLTFGSIAITPASCSGGSTFSGTTITTTAAGAFTCVVAIPAGSLAGVGTMLATDASGGQTASAPFTVTAWTISPLSVTSGIIGTSVTVTGTGFAVSSGVVLTFGNIAITPASCSGGSTFSGTTITTTAAGAFTCVVAIPAGSLAGLGTMTATDASGGQTATASFTVTAWTISLSLSSGLVNKSITVTGAGFAVSSTVVLTFSGISITPTGGASCTYTGSTITATAAGGFTCTVSIPYGSASGLGTMTATDTSGAQVATAPFTVSAWTISYTCPSTCPHGTSETATITGSGFVANSILVFTYNGVAITPAAACASGNITGTNTIKVTGQGGFVCTFTIGTNSAAGTYTFVATDSTSGQVATTYIVRS
jgi:hypothetical protein